MELEEIKKLAAISRIEMSDEEMEGLSKDLAITLTYIDQINKAELPESEIEIPEHRNAYREDVVTTIRGSYTEILLAQFVDRQDGFLKVKKIL